MLTNPSSNPCAPSVDDELLTKEQLRERLNLPSLRSIDTLMAARKIPFIKMGHRTIRFNLARVKAVLAKLEVRALSEFETPASKTEDIAQ